jgi:hypothetical protein
MVYGLGELGLTCHVHIAYLKQEDGQSMSLLSLSPLLEVVLFQATFDEVDADDDSVNLLDHGQTTKTELTRSPGKCMCN